MNYPIDEGYRAHDALYAGDPFTTTDGISLSYAGSVKDPTNQTLVTETDGHRENHSMRWGSDSCFRAIRTHRERCSL